MDPDERLEAAFADTSWLPDDVEVIEEPGFLAMACARPGTDYNRVLRLRPGGREQAVVARISELHHGFDSVVQVTPLSHGTALERTLLEHGYTRCERHHGYTCRVESYAPRPHPGIEARLVTTMSELRAFTQTNNAAFNRNVQRSEEELKRFLADGNGARIRRAIAWEGNRALSAGGITAHPRLGIGVLWAGGTIPEGRGRGAYSAVMAARIAWAKSIGLQSVGLYARRDSSAPIVKKQGFQRHGFMDYWRRPAGHG